MRFLKYFTAALLPMVVLATPPPAHNARAELPSRSVLETREPQLSEITDLIKDFIPNLKALLDLLEPDVISGIKTVVLGLAVVFGGDTPQQTKTLISSASGLLTPQLTKQIGALLPSVTSLLTTDTINGIKTLLTNAEALLTAKFVSQVSGLINDVAPLVSAVAQVITTLISAVLG